MTQEDYENAYRAFRHALQDHREKTQPWAEANLDMLARTIGAVNTNAFIISVLALVCAGALVAIAIKLWFFSV